MLILFIFNIYFPIDSWQNEYLDEIQVRGYYKCSFPSVRPYDFDRKAGLLDPFSKHLWIPNFSGNFRVDTVRVFRLKPLLFCDISDFTFFMEPVLKFGQDSLPPNKYFMDLVASDYERAYIKFQNKNLLIFVGRERFSIGPSPIYNILLSGYSTPMDWFNFSVENRYLKFSFYLSRLEDKFTKPLEYTGDTITRFINARRYLSIRRLDFSPAEWLNMSFTEAATFGGEHFSLNIYHFNPIILLHTYQHNWNQDANLFFHLDTRLFFHNFSIYGALLVDDYQLEKDPNNEPNHLGMKIGAEFADLLRFKRSFLIFEYTAITRYTYCHFVPYQRYEFRHTPIGAIYGNDYDNLFMKLVRHQTPKFDWYTIFSYLRKGESKITTIWPIPEQPRVPGTEFPSNNFLSGCVQHSYTIGGGVRFFLKHWAFGEFYLGYLYIKNFEHKNGNTKTSISFKLQFDILNISGM